MENIICIRALADVDQINNCKKKIEKKENTFSELSSVLGLAGNEVRLKLLYALHEENELCVCDLSDILNMKVSAISQHLRKLKDGNIVDVRKDGQTYFYSLKFDHLSVLEPFFELINTKREILNTEMI